MGKDNRTSFVDHIIKEHVSRGYNSRDVYNEMEMISKNEVIMKETSLPQERQLIFAAMADDRLKQTLLEGISRNTVMGEDYSTMLESEFLYAINKITSNKWNPKLYEGFEEIIENLQQGRMIQSSDMYLLNVLESYYDNQIDKLEETVVESVLEATSLEGLNDVKYVDSQESLETKAYVTEASYKASKGLMKLESLKIKKDIARFVLMEQSVEEDKAQLQYILEAASGYDTFLESTTSWKEKLKKITFDLEKDARKLTSKAVDKSKGAKRNTQAAAKAVKHFTNLANEVVDDLEDKAVAKKKDEVIQSKFRRKIVKLLRYTIMNAGILVFTAGSPAGFAIAAVSTMVGLHIEKNADINIHKELIRDLEVELRITGEKIREAEGRGDTKAKYQLIRIEESIKDDLTRLRKINIRNIEGRSQTKRHRNA